MKTWDPVAVGTPLGIHTCDGKAWLGRLLHFEAGASGGGVVRLDVPIKPGGSVDIDLESITAVEHGPRVLTFLEEI